MGKCIQTVALAITLAFLISVQVTQGKEHSPKDHDSNFEGTPARKSNKEFKKNHIIKGHEKPFGESGSISAVKEVEGFPTNFFKGHLLPSLPVLMKGAAKISPAFEKWTDVYLRKIADTPENRKLKLEVEIRKREIRDYGMKEMSMVEFLDVYNSSDLYVVSDVPSFMAPDLVMPCALQCGALEAVPMTKLMWFSSGGTSSVVHTDSYDNINCLFRGRKRLFLLNPASITVGSIIDRPDGAFSNIDVDRVDLYKYPTLRYARFLEVIMSPGDCLYIPYLWIHQVRSFDSNLAVNFWIDHHETMKLLKSDRCMEDNPKCDLKSTIDLWHHQPATEEYSASEMLTGKDLLKLLFGYSAHHVDKSTDSGGQGFGKEKVKVQTFVKVLASNLLLNLDEDDQSDVSSRSMQLLKDAISTMDTDKDGVLTMQEFQAGEDRAWKVISKQLLKALRKHQEKSKTKDKKDIMDDDVEEEMMRDEL